LKGKRFLVDTEPPILCSRNLRFKSEEYPIYNFLSFVFIYYLRVEFHHLFLPEVSTMYLNLCTKNKFEKFNALVANSLALLQKKALNGNSAKGLVLKP